VWSRIFGKSTRNEKKIPRLFVRPDSVRLSMRRCIGQRGDLWPPRCGATALGNPADASCSERSLECPGYPSHSQVRRMGKTKLLDEGWARYFDLAWTAQGQEFPCRRPGVRVPFRETGRAPGYRLTRPTLHVRVAPVNVKDGERGLYAVPARRDAPSGARPGNERRVVIPAGNPALETSVSSQTLRPRSTSMWTVTSSIYPREESTFS
jgi:hypothetical protein